jgi:hypothetical protein
MCQFKSCIILKDRVFVPDYDSHTDMLKELGIEDTFENASARFVRAEIVPNRPEDIADVKARTYRVDQDILPDWYVPEIDEACARAAVAEWVAAHTIMSGVREVNGGMWIAYDSATVTAFGSATVIIPKNASNCFDRIEVNDFAVAIDHNTRTIKSAQDAPNWKESE